MSQDQVFDDEEEITYNFNEEIIEEDLNDVVKVQLSSNTIVIDYYQLLKWSKLIKNYYQKDTINQYLSNDIQKHQQKFNIDEKNIVSFFNCIKNEKVQIKKSQYCDFLKLSKILIVPVFSKLLRKYSQSHINDIDFIINVLTDQLSSQNVDEFYIDEISPEMEECLSANINRCLMSSKFGQLPIQIVHRIIEKGCDQISPEKLFEFIKSSYDERFILLPFLNIRDLSKENFNELYDNLYNSQNSMSKKYFDYLTFDLPYLKEIKNENEHLKNQLNMKEGEIHELQKQILEQNNQNEARISEFQSTHDQILSEKESQISILEQKVRELQAQMLEQNSQNEARISELQSTHDQILSEKESQISILEQKGQKINDEISKIIKVISDLISAADVEQDKRPNLKKIILPIAAKLGNSDVVKRLSTINKIDVNSKYILYLFLI